MQGKVRNYRILVVDDHKAVRQLLVEMLAEMGFVVESVKSGEQALDVLAVADRTNQPYDLVLLDWKMPGGIDGLETYEKMEKLVLHKKPEVIMLTGYSHEQLVQERQFSSLPILQKPVSASSLTKAIEAVLSPAVVEEWLKEQLAPLRNSRILLVEDSELNQEVAKQVLLSGGLQVDIAVNGKMALHKLAEQKYDLVLMDMYMPVMDGLTATRLIRQQPSLQKLPIIALTGSDTVKDRENCLAAGMNEDFISKPLAVERLVEVLLRWIPAKQEVSPSQSLPQPGGQGDIPPELAGVEASELDVQAGLYRALQQPEFYKKLLRTFMENQALACERIRQELAEGAWHKAERTAHTLKSTAATIGGVKVQKAAAELERHIKTRQLDSDLEQRMLEASKATEELVNLLQTIIARKQKNFFAQRLNPGEEKRLLLKLESLLLAGDSEAVDVWEAAIPSVHYLFQYPETRELCQALENYDFLAALEWLHKVKERIL